LLVRVFEILNERLQSAPLNVEGLPELEGIEWNPSSPVAGTLEDVPPFGNIDTWTALSGQPAATPRHRHRRRSQPPPEREGSSRPSVAEPESATGPFTSLPEVAGRTLAVEGSQELGNEPESGILPIAHLVSDAIAEAAGIAEIFAVEVAGSLFSALIIYVELFMRLAEGEQKCRAGGTRLGIKFGMLALLRMTHEAQIPQSVNARQLEALVHQDTLYNYEWERQARFAGQFYSSFVEGLHAGLEIVAQQMNDTTHHVEERFRSRLEQQIPDRNERERIYQQNVNEIRRQVYSRAAQEFFQRVGRAQQD